MQLRDRSRSEQGEDKKLSRLLSDMGQFLESTAKMLDTDAPARTKAKLSEPLKRLRETRDEVEQLRQLAEEDRAAKRAAMLRRSG